MQEQTKTLKTMRKCDAYRSDQVGETRFKLEKNLDASSPK